MAGSAGTTDVGQETVTAQLQDNSGNAIINGQKTMANSVPVVVASDQTAIPVSGTVTANQGTAAATAGAWPTKLTDGTNITAVKAASTAAVATDPSAVVALSPNSPLPAGSNNIGSVNQGTSPWVANISQFGGNNVVTGTGGSGNGIPRVTVANDSTNDVNPWFVTQVDTRKSSYAASVLSLVPALLATDVFVISGSGTKTIRIVKIGISGTESTAAIRDIQFIKRSALDTSGTSTTQTAVPLDSNNAAATATVKAYTANPTALGAAIGTIQTFKLGTPAANVNASLNPQEFMFGELTQAIVLRGTSENLAINLNGTTITGASFDIYVWWTEE